MTALVLVLVLAAPIVSAQGQASLVPPHTDSGIDINGNSLFEVLRMYVEVDVTIAGTFFVFVDLYDNSGFFYITGTSAFVNLPLGPSTVIADLSGPDIFNAGFNGPYTVNLQVYDDFGNLDDSGVHMTLGYAFTDFEPPEAAFAPPHSDTAIDTDADTLYDILRVNATVDVTTAGTFDLIASAYDMSSVFITSAFVSVNLPVGPGQIITVDFAGWPFRSNGVDGPYTVDMSLYGASGFLGTDSHTTAAYRAIDFEPSPGFLTPPHSDRGVDTDGDVLFNSIEVNVSMQVNTSGDFTLDIFFLDSTNTTFLGGNSSSVTLGIGLQDVPIWMSTVGLVAAGIDGPYNVQITLWDASFNLVDSGDHYTRAYMISEFDPTPASFDPPHSDTGVDTDGDTLFNFLRVDVSLAVNESGPYGIFAQLWDLAMTTPIAFEFRIANLPQGAQTISVDFSGITIRQSGINGPYFVDMVLFQPPFTFLGTGNHTTQFYFATEFQNVVPETLDGTVRDSVSSAGIPGANVAAFDYANGVSAFTNADGTGFYSLGVHQGNWTVLFDGGAHDAAVAPVAITGPTTLDFDLVASTPDPVFGNITLTTWNTLALAYNAFMETDVVFTRVQIDWALGNRDGSVSQSEWDTYLLFAGFAPTPLNSTWDVFLTDSRWYELIPGSDNFAFWDAPGPVGSTVPIRLEFTGGYQNGTIAPAASHTVLVNVTYDTMLEDGRYNAVLPPGYVLTGVVGAPNMTVTGIGTNTASINPGGDPNPFDSFDYAWIQLNATTADTTPPSVGSPSASPNPVVSGNTVTISASATDNQGIGSVRLQVWNPSGGLVLNVSMTDVGAGSYNHSFSPGPVGSWTFTVTATDVAGNTASRNGAFGVIELTPPTISAPSATPSPQEYGQTVLIAANVTDNTAVGTVAVAVRDVGGTSVGNFTMTFNAGTGRYEYSAAFLELGVNSYTIWATDTSGNVASASGTFEIVDTTDPVLAGATAVPNPVEVGTPVLIRVTATDLTLTSVSVVIRGPSNVVMGTFAMALVAGTYQYSYTPTELGIYTFNITATDGAGNSASASGAFTSQDTTDPVADAGADANARVGLVVSLDGSGSTDNHGIVDYTWTFMEGTQARTMTGVAPTHTFTAAGTYIITLNVTDASGNYAVDTVTITVQVVAPAGGLAGWVISLILAIVVAVIVAALLLFMRRKKATAAPPPGAEGTAPPPEAPESPPPPPQE